jgi:hypothetical protein
VERVGHGFRNFGNYRLRLLLRCGTVSDASVTTTLRAASTLHSEEPLFLH